MKHASPLLVIFAALSLVEGRPRITAQDSDSISQTSRVTAFRITDDGPVVECWLIGDLLPDASVTRKDGSQAAARRLNMFNDNPLAGVDILTWPSYATIWPPSTGEAHGNAEFDFEGYASTFTLLNGLVTIEGLFPTFSTEDTPVYYFGPDNGDDWFYFEDSTTSDLQGCPKKKSSDAAFKVSTVSGGETSLIQFKHKKTPQHRVLHKGPCHFAGLVDDQPEGNGRARSGRQEVLEL